MASVSVPGMSGWGNGIHRSQAPLHPRHETARCQGAFLWWAADAHNVAQAFEQPVTRRVDERWLHRPVLEDHGRPVTAECELA